MTGLARYFMILAGICALVGMAWGIQMSATADHTLSPAHAHLNLLGWVSLSIFGIYYHVVPTAAQSLLAKVHFGLAVAGVVIIVPGIVAAVQMTGEVMAKLGSVLTILSMLCFVVVLVLNPKGR